MGITFLYQSTDSASRLWSSLPYFMISLSLNILITLTIVTQLLLHTRNLRATLGRAGSGGLYNTVVTMLIESSAVYAVISLLVIGPWVSGNHIADNFLSILTRTQVRASLHPADTGQPNILVDDSGNARITDFGLATVTQNPDTMQDPSCQHGHTRRGPTDYQTPGMCVLQSSPLIFIKQKNRTIACSPPQGTDKAVMLWKKPKSVTAEHSTAFVPVPIDASASAPASHQVQCIPLPLASAHHRVSRRTRQQ